MGNLALVVIDPPLIFFAGDTSIPVQMHRRVNLPLAVRNFFALALFEVFFFHIPREAGLRQHRQFGHVFERIFAYRQQLEQPPDFTLNIIRRNRPVCHAAGDTGLVLVARHATRVH